MRNNIYVSINKAILYVGIIYLFIKYQYVNAFFFSLLSIFISLWSNFNNVSMFIQYLGYLVTTRV